MSTLSKLFGKSPFKAFKKHMAKVSECMDRIEPLFEALYNKDYDAIRSISKEIMKIEHEADEIKDEIRDNLPKSLFLPVDRRDLLNLLSAQDSIADNIEDLSVLLSLKDMEVHESILPLLKKLISNVLRTVYEGVKVINELDNLIEASFGGPEAEKVFEMVNNMGRMEWESDKVQYTLAKEVLSLEDKIGAVSIIMWMKIFEKLAEIADSSEKLGKMLRMFMAN